MLPDCVFLSLHTTSWSEQKNQLCLQTSMANINILLLKMTIKRWCKWWCVAKIHIYLAFGLWVVWAVHQLLNSKRTEPRPSLFVFALPSHFPPSPSSSAFSVNIICTSVLHSHSSITRSLSCCLAETWPCCHLSVHPVNTQETVYTTLQSDHEVKKRQCVQSIKLQIATVDSMCRANTKADRYLLLSHVSETWDSVMRKCRKWGLNS